MLMYEIWSLGHKLFVGKNNRQVIDLIDTGYRLPPPPGCPRAVYQIMMDTVQFLYTGTAGPH